MTPLRTRAWSRPGETRTTSSSSPASGSASPADTLPLRGRSCRRSSGSQGSGRRRRSSSSAARRSPSPRAARASRPPGATGRRRSTAPAGYLERHLLRSVPELPDENHRPLSVRATTFTQSGASEDRDVVRPPRPRRADAVPPDRKDPEVDGMPRRSRCQGSGGPGGCDPGFTLDIGGRRTPKSVSLPRRCRSRDDVRAALRVLLQHDDLSFSAARGARRKVRKP